MAKNEWHWFASTETTWACDESEELPRMLRRLKRAEKLFLYASLYKVPGSARSEYEIDDLVPQVKGTKRIAKIRL